MKIKSLILCLIILLTFGLTAFCACDNDIPNNGNGNPGVQNPADMNGEKNTVTTVSGGLAEKAKLGFDVKAQLKEWGIVNDFSLKEALLPIWDTKNVYNETVSFVGKTDTAKLLYTPTKIHKVYDYYLGKEYVEGVDFVVNGNQITLTENTAVNYWQKTDYYGIVKPSISITLKTKDGYYLPVSEVLANTHQICVSYEHNDKWQGIIPVAQTEKFSNTIAKLKNGQGLKIGVVGDSITVGCGSSGYLKYHEGNTDPVLGGVNPYNVEGLSYIRLVNEYLNAKFPLASIELDNKAVGGSAADKGADQVSKLTIVPDLMIIAFGMNDAGGTVENYYKRIKATIDAVVAKNPQVEILLVSSMLPNNELVGWTGNIPTFESKLLEISKEYKNTVKIGVAPMTSMSQSTYDLGKRSCDMNSSNVNHPNDFIHRVYAQTVLKVLLGNDFTTL